jgi:hypothetical protein
VTDFGSYTCGECGGTYEKTRSDEEALAETATLFAGEYASEDDLAMVCDDCWNAMRSIGLF